MILVSSSCSLLKIEAPKLQSADNNITLSPFPLDPQLPNWTSPPVLTQDADGNYIVTDEFLRYGMRVYPYHKKVLQWQSDNLIP